MEKGRDGKGYKGMEGKGSGNVKGRNGRGREVDGEWRREKGSGKGKEGLRREERVRHETGPPTFRLLPPPMQLTVSLSSSQDIQIHALQSRAL